MYVDATSYLNSTYDPTLTDSTASGELGQDAFLQLLMAQLEWQDPLDPMDDTEMVAQLAQFSSLEALQEMTGQLDSMTTLLTSQISMSATGYMGKEVEAAGSSLSKDGESVSSVTYTLGADSATTYAYVFDTAGDIVAAVDLGERASGEHTFVWDGKTADGNEAADGQYAIAFLCETGDGESFYASAQVSGLVTSVYQEDGEVMLGLADGRTVSLANVTKVVDTGLTASADEE
ncbi:flagellar hook capping FlgD N-terminal domain-containing protein [Desulfocurvus sp.]|jgi:flagellar basal-body rod modification protein FlgD|uniref:flagellar hook assembly protein FlgD n=1 Tax=Desulfocurvus sp. TaxID=2871698 RepID=UPI0025BD3F6D|nr:flagellar hook capping FlgD N-terminal domain-containing protein [Desulfocurvus sp.]MCK9240837.1 hypothetical protein [Desulfocurvus sp.]